jgi:hypothetical protein
MLTENQKFHKNADYILNARLKDFEYYTSITPTVHKRKHQLQFYINKRNRGGSCVWQHVQDRDVSEVGASNYSDWMDQRLTGDSDSDFEGPIQANPDRLPEKAEDTSELFTGMQIHTARKVLSKAHMFLTPREFLVFQMKFVEALTPTEIAERMGINYRTVHTYIHLLVPKLKKAFQQYEER